MKRGNNECVGNWEKYPVIVNVLFFIYSSNVYVLLMGKRLLYKLYEHCRVEKRIYNKIY